eukprot:m.194359 g.194359  ORF g.194359 m.194359 type:complete len:66 (-) comp19167_c0_seq1:1519-1716(-)
MHAVCFHTHGGRPCENLHRNPWCMHDVCNQGDERTQAPQHARMHACFCATTAANTPFMQSQWAPP